MTEKARPSREERVEAVRNAKVETYASLSSEERKRPLPEGVAPTELGRSDVATGVSHPAPSESGELATQERRYLPNPVTGEAIDLRGDDEHVVAALDEIRNVELQLRGMKRIVSDELLARMDRNAEWTLRAGGLEARGRSPEPVSEYDGHALAAVLDDHVNAGELSKRRQRPRWKSSCPTSRN